MCKFSDSMFTFHDSIFRFCGNFSEYYHDVKITICTHLLKMSWCWSHCGRGPDLHRSWWFCHQRSVSSWWPPTPRCHNYHMLTSLHPQLNCRTSPPARQRHNTQQMSYTADTDRIAVQVLHPAGEVGRLSDHHTHVPVDLQEAGLVVNHL